MKTTNTLFKIIRAVNLMILLGFISSCQKGDKLSDAYGNFEARSIFISSEISGKLLEFELIEGVAIEEGIKIAVVDTIQIYLKIQDLEVQKKAIRSKISILSAQVLTLKEQIRNLDIELVRAESLYADGALTEQALDQIKGNKRVLISQINAFEIQKESVYTEIDVLDQKQIQARDQFDKCFIYNPLKGTVLETYAEEFEMVMAGKSLYKIANLDQLELKVYVSGTDLRRVKLGALVKVMVDQDIKSNIETTGIVSWISSQAEFTPKIIQTKEERVNLVYAVKVLVENDGSLKIGMPGEVIFND